MMRSPLCKFAGMASWLITALASINIGLRPFGYDVLAMPFFASHPTLVVAIHYIVGVAGLLSLIMFVMMCTGKGCHCCSDSSCSCCSNCKCGDNKPGNGHQNKF